MEDFPANSQKAKAKAETPPPSARPQVQQITSAKARQRKRGLGRRMKEVFIVGDARGAMQHAVTDVVIPEIRDTAFNAFQAGLERLFFGESSRIRRPTSNPYSTGHVNYQAISRPTTASRPTAPRPISQQARARQDFGEIVIPSRQDANEVLEQMYELLSRYGVVTVADLYALTGIASTHVDHSWGWTALTGSRPRRLSDGNWLLDLPKPEKLD